MCFFGAQRDGMVEEMTERKRYTQNMLKRKHMKLKHSIC